MLVYLLLGLAIGLVIGFLIAKVLTPKAKQGIDTNEISEKYVLKDIYLKLEEEKERYRKSAELEQLQNRDLREKLNKTESEVKIRDLKLSGLEQRMQQHKEEMTLLQEKFRLEFENLANKILEDKTKKFTEANEEKLGNLLNPLRDQIKNFNEKVDRSFSEEAKDKATLKEQIKQLASLNKQLSDDATKLTRALKGDTKTQGNWGEMQLSLILEKAGLQESIHYEKESSFRTDDGTIQRPDYIVKLPEGKNIIIDSKVSLTAYAEFFNETDETAKALRLRQHLMSINNHIRSLADKNYQNIYQINQPDFILMFLANEPALNIALKEDPQLFERAMERNIVMVSASTLLATLRTISFIWRQENQKNNALEIARQAGDLYDKIQSFSEDLEKVERALNTAQGALGESKKKLTDGRGNVISRLERIRKLGANTSKKFNNKLLSQAKENDGEE